MSTTRDNPPMSTEPYTPEMYNAAVSLVEAAVNMMEEEMGGRLSAAQIHKYAVQMAVGTMELMTFVIPDLEEELPREDEEGEDT